MRQFAATLEARLSDADIQAALAALEGRLSARVEEAACDAAAQVRRDECDDGGGPLRGCGAAAADPCHSIGVQGPRVWGSALSLE